MYQPKLREDLMPCLYQLGKTLDVPMTKLASALLEFGIRCLEDALSQRGYTPPAPAPITRNDQRKPSF